MGSDMYDILDNGKVCLLVNEGVVIAQAESSLSDGICTQFLACITSKHTGETVGTDQCRGMCVGEGRIRFAKCLCFGICGNGDGSCCDGEVRPGVGDGIVVSCREGSLLDGIGSGVFPWSPSQRAGEAVSGKQCRGGGIGQCRVRFPVLLGFCLGCHLDSLFGNGQIRSGVGDCVVVSCREGSLLYGVGSRVFSGYPCQGTCKGVGAHKGRTCCIGQCRVGRTIDLCFSLSSDLYVLFGDGQIGRNECNLVFRSA